MIKGFHDYFFFTVRCIILIPPAVFCLCREYVALLRVLTYIYWIDTKVAYIICNELDIYYTRTTQDSNASDWNQCFFFQIKARIRSQMELIHRERSSECLQIRYAQIHPHHQPPATPNYQILKVSGISKYICLQPYFNIIEEIFNLLKSCNFEFVSCRVADNFFH